MLDQIRAAPDDDELRQVYADALIQRGDPRGELISVQLRLARAPDDELRERERALLDEHGEELLAHIGLEPMHLELGTRFERGFVEELVFNHGFAPDFDAFLANGLPPRMIRVEDAHEPALAQMLARAPLLARVEQLDIYGDRRLAREQAPAAAPLVAQAHLPRLRRLALSYIARDGAVDALCPILGPLASFALMDMLYVDDADVQRLVESCGDELVSLNLAFNGPLGDFIEPTIDRLALLERFRLDNMIIAPLESLAAVFQRSQRLVDFAANIPMSWDVAPIYDALGDGCGARLRTLVLSDWDGLYADDEMDADVENALAALAERMERVEVFAASSTPFGDAGAHALARLSSEDLVELDLAYANITAHGLRALLANPRFHRLRRLDIGGNPELGDEGIEILAATPFTQLDVLDVTDCELADLEPLRPIAANVLD